MLPVGWEQLPRRWVRLTAPLLYVPDPQWLPVTTPMPTLPWTWGWLYVASSQWGRAASASASSWAAVRPLVSP